MKPGIVWLNLLGHGQTYELRRYYLVTMAFREDLKYFARACCFDRHPGCEEAIDRGKLGFRAFRV